MFFYETQCILSVYFDYVVLGRTHTILRVHLMRRIGYDWLTILAIFVGRGRTFAFQHEL